MATPDQESNCSIHGESEDDEYIDMEVNSCSSSSIHGGEFEFQMSSSSSLLETNHTNNTSPADELFYKGNLLPLHLPPRLQLVQSLLLQSSASTSETAAVTPVTTSPSGSGRVSSELNPDDDCFFDWSAETSGGRFLLEDDDIQNKKSSSSSSSSPYSWGKKLRQSVLCQKIKSSRSYLKALLLFRNDESFGRSATNLKTESAANLLFRNDESSKKLKIESAAAAEDAAGKRECFISKFPRVMGRKKIHTKGNNNNNNNPFGRIENYERFEYGSTLKKRIEKEMAEECLGLGGFSSNRNSISISTNSNYMSQQRKSFSGAIQCHVSSSSKTTTSSSSTSSSSSSFSLSSDKLYYDLLWLKKGSGGDSTKEIESSIEGAIAHCKKSRENAKSKGAAAAGVSPLIPRQIETPKMCV